MSNNDDVLFTWLNDYGTKCVENRQFAGAEQALLQANKLKPDNIASLTNLGAFYWHTLNFPKAHHYLNQALAANDHYAPAHSNLGLLLDSENNFEGALKHHQIAINLDPNQLSFQWDRMITYLDMGNWEQGFNEYNVRFKYKNKEYTPLPYPEWEGEDLNGKTVYIQTEQGVGDRILFARFLKVLKELYPTCKILLITESENYPLFWAYRQFGYIDEFIPLNVPYPKADYGIYLMSIARVLNLRYETAPTNNDLLQNYARHFAKGIKLTTNRHSPKVGICWGGNPLFIMNHWRSIPFEKICKLVDDPDIAFFSFQADDRAKDIEKYGMTAMLFDLSPQIKKDGWNGTMGCLQHMDLVISMDTALVHLAASMNLPVWNLLNTASYWPYGRFELTTPWYPTMKIFRQPSPGDWDGVIDKVKEELQRFKAEFFSKQVISVYKDI